MTSRPRLPGICAKTGKAPGKPGPAGPLALGKGLTSPSPGFLLCTQDRSLGKSVPTQQGGRVGWAQDPAGPAGGGRHRSPAVLGNASKGVFQPRSLVVSSYSSPRFQGVGKPQISEFGRQGTIIEPLLYFPIWSPAPAGTGSIIIYDAAPEAEGRRPKKPHLLGVALPVPALRSQVAEALGVGTGRRQRVEAVGIPGGGGGGQPECGQLRPRPDHQPDPHPVAEASRD